MAMVDVDRGEADAAERRQHAANQRRAFAAGRCAFAAECRTSRLGTRHRRKTGA